MTWTFCTSGSAIRKAGVNANSTIILSGSALADWCDEAESHICDVARVDLVSNYSSLTSNGKNILQKACSAMVAMNIVGYAITSYPLSREAETILDLLEDQKTEALNAIKDDKVKTYLGAT